MPIAGGWRAQFVALAAIWGSSFLFIKVLDERHWPPTWVALGRVALGAATLVVLVYARGERLRVPRSAWPHILIAALFLNAIPFTLFAFGEHHVSSVVAGLWNASAPLWVLVFVLLVFNERPTTARAAGLAFGFAGVVLLLGPWRGLGGGQAVGHLACAGAAVCYGIGFPTRGATSRLGLRAASCSACWARVWRTCSTTRSSAPPARPRPRPSPTSCPCSRPYSGRVVLGEAVCWNQPVGAAVLLTGIAISQGRLRRPRTPRPPKRAMARSR